MNPKLLKEITKRVQQVKTEKADESLLASHLDAIAEIFETDRATVESIARDVMAQQGATKAPVDLVKVRNMVWISALVLVMVSVIWLLYSNVQGVNVADSNGLSKENQRTLLYVGEALASLNVVKISITEQFQTTGVMPSSFSEAGIRESELVRTKYIDRLTITADGTILVSLSRLIGDERYIKLKPIVRMATYEVEWDCRSNMALAILDEIQGCTPDI